MKAKPIVCVSAHGEFTGHWFDVPNGSLAYQQPSTCRRCGAETTWPDPRMREVWGRAWVDRGKKEGVA